MGKFRKGDKVRVLPGEGINNFSDEENIKDREVFEIADTFGSDGVYLVGKNKDWGYGDFRFQLVTTNMDVKENKMQINYHVLNDSIVLNYSGKTLVIASSDNRYSKVLDAIKREDLDSIPELVEVEREFEGTGVELRDGLLYENGNPLPSELSNRILKFKEVGVPCAPLFKFWDNLKANPSFNARKMMFAFIEHNGIPLTQDGCFIAYRGVREDFKDKHTGTFDNKPGSVCEMSRDAVDDNPNNTCSAGLHVACYEYAKSFGPKMVEVKVNPKDVVCVPVDYNGTKMRTCRFEVIQECEAIRTELVYDKPVESDEDPDLKEGECLGCPF